jgi:starch phosphorylase
LNGIDVRIGTSVEALERAITDNLRYAQGRAPGAATPNDWYMALAYTVRDHLLARWIQTTEALMRHEGRVVSYLSAEFLLGPHLGMNLINLGIEDEAREAVRRLGLDLDALIAQEEEPGLGNGGLGRLAACYLDSLATLEVPAIGYGIRYEYGIFDQEIKDGWQVEVADRWLRHGNPWEIARPDLHFEVGFEGTTEGWVDEKGRQRARWAPARVVRGSAYDTPILGYRVSTANLLRLWKAEATEDFEFEAFDRGDYMGAVDQKIVAENITKVLYPNDSMLQGKQLRLEQQYLFTSCSLQDMIRIHTQAGGTPETFHEAFAVQLNDTHPSISVAELMRLFVDVHGVDWEPAWEATRKTFGYTNHTLLPEALERWPLSLFGRLLPRHLEIVTEINRRFLDGVRAAHPGDEALVARLSLFDETGERSVRMAHLAAVGSHAINGVAALHTELLKRDVLPDLFALDPTRFHSVTNGVSPRRFVRLSNPRLSKLLGSKIGGRWLLHPEEELPRIETFVEDPAFRAEWRAVKLANKQDLATLMERTTGVVIDARSLFDVQVKRLHEYKRQHLNVLHIVTLYDRLLRDPNLGGPARTFVFGAKAAPGYTMAKLIIKLIHSVASVVNTDPAMRERLRVVFIPNFNVQNGQLIYPAADVSEQISTAGKEASGTGNMKFALNGAITVGTLDGANIEIRESVGADNFFLFGLTADQVRERRAAGYRPRDVVDTNSELAKVLSDIAGGRFSPEEPKLFAPLVDSLLTRDEYMLLADYASYVECQERVARAFLDEEAWTRMSILNTARSGHFSSDRSIREYCTAIWNTHPITVPVTGTGATGEQAFVRGPAPW